MDLRDKVVLITGSSRGIGLALAKEFAKNGAKIALNGRNRERLEKAHRNLGCSQANAIAIPADVSSAKECQAMINQVVEKFGHLHILINNAGVSMRTPLAEIDGDTCKKIVDINLLGCVYPTLYSLPEIKKSKGSLVYISSIAGLVGLPTASLYCATKTALKGFSDSLRCELAPHGVHVAMVYVGFTENDPEKTVIGAGGREVPPNRPAHMSQEQVAKAVVRLVKKRRKRVVLSRIGKLVQFATWLCPGLVEKAIILSQKYSLGERLAIR